MTQDQFSPANAQGVSEALEGAFHAGFNAGEAAGKFEDDNVVDAWSRYSAALSGAEAKPVAHPDDEAVNRFADAMKAKLAKKREEGRGGWETCTHEYLSELLRDHVEKGDPVDVGNLAMMIHQLGGRVHG